MKTRRKATLNLELGLLNRLHAASEATGQSMSSITNEAIDNYLNRDERLLQAIRQIIKEELSR
jgi:predicted DNA-binding protein